ncbi:hypothetical protein [Bacillus sp. Marseille-P3800]|uniref:hypothetical protein n=1 Tax=Bacillus sp. Marseille-P3800 TaxID=2014782 RepID=UPI000C07CF52|nr:hypothetical protein [Bacillus sp. Marseille-P3800]
MNYFSLDQLPHFVQWSTIIITIVPVVVWIIKVVTKTPLQLLYEPRHKKVIHDLSIVIIISFFILLMFINISFRTAEYVNGDFLNFIASLAILLFLLIFAIVFVHYIILSFKEEVMGKKEKYLYKSLAVIGLLSLFVVIYSLNTIQVQEILNTANEQENLYTIEQLLLLLIQLIFLIISFSAIPIYKQKLENSGYYYEIEIIPEEEQFRLPKKMIFQYSIREDIQVMSLPHTKEKDILTQDTFYVYHLQTKQFQRIEGKRIKN